MYFHALIFVQTRLSESILTTKYLRFTVYYIYTHAALNIPRDPVCIVAKSIMVNVVLTRNAEMGEVIPVEIDNMRLDCNVGEGEPKFRAELEAEWKKELEERIESERRQEDEEKLLKDIRQGMEGYWRRELEQKVSSKEEARMEQLQLAWRRQWEKDMEKKRKMQLERQKKGRDKEGTAGGVVEETMGSEDGE